MLHSLPKATSFPLPNLRPNTQYKLRLLAENVVAKSPYSQATPVFTTAKAVPDTPPTDLEVVPDAATVLRVSWTVGKSKIETCTPAS